MMNLTIDEIKHISKPPINFGRDKIWVKAFAIYNAAHPIDRPLSMNCMPCYIKVFKYIRSIS